MSEFRTSTPVDDGKGQGCSYHSAIKRIEAKFEQNQCFETEKDTRFTKWLNYFLRFSDELRREIREFEDDQAKVGYYISINYLRNIFLGHL